MDKSSFKQLNALNNNLLMDENLDKLGDLVFLTYQINTTNVKDENFQKYYNKGVRNAKELDVLNGMIDFFKFHQIPLQLDMTEEELENIQPNQFTYTYTCDTSGYYLRCPGIRIEIYEGKSNEEFLGLNINFNANPFEYNFTHCAENKFDSFNSIGSSILYWIFQHRLMEFFNYIEDFFVREKVPDIDNIKGKIPWSQISYSIGDLITESHEYKSSKITKPSHWIRLWKGEWDEELVYGEISLETCEWYIGNSPVEKYGSYEQIANKLIQYINNEKLADLEKYWNVFFDLENIKRMDKTNLTETNQILYVTNSNVNCFIIKLLTGAEYKPILTVNIYTNNTWEFNGNPASEISTWKEIANKIKEFINNY